jgi:outer membrane protein OmpA-like peptidoglycan-associated protein
MADAAPNRAPGQAAPGAGSQNGDFAKLRELLVGPEREEIRQLQEHLQDLNLRAKDVGEVLSKAIELRSSDAKLRKSLGPILLGGIEKLAQSRPRTFAKAFYPAILSAVRRAVAEALSDMSETLNQIIEKSVSLRGLQWRVEAILTGKRFSDLLLARSLLYSVQQVFLIHSKTGLLLKDVVAPDVKSRDPDLVSSMLTAIQDWVHDSFEGTEDQRIENVKLGDTRIWIQHGQYASLAAAILGTPPVELRGKLRSSLAKIESEQGAELKEFSGDAAPFDASRPYLEACLLGKSNPKPRRYWIRWAAWASIILVAIGVFAFLSMQERQRWSNYFAKLDGQPGIVVTRVEKRGPVYWISGLRDPLAADPVQLLAQQGIPVNRAIFHWEPYLSSNALFTAQRRFVSQKESIERCVLRFEKGAAKLSEAQTIAGEQIANEIRALFQAAEAIGHPVRVQLTGHTDELGSEQLNARLSEDRAQEVRELLVTQGIAAGRLVTRGAATAEPVRPGSSEREQTYNRSVTFHVIGK